MVETLFWVNSSSKGHLIFKLSNDKLKNVSVQVSIMITIFVKLINYINNSLSLNKGNLGSAVDWISDLNQRRGLRFDSLAFYLVLQSLVLYFKCFKLDGPNSISQLFKAIMGNYNLRGSGLNVVWPSYNNLVRHNSFLFEVSNMWNQLPVINKSQTTWAQFRIKLFSFEWCGVCRMPVYQLYFLTQIFNIRIILHFNSEFILAIQLSYCKQSCVFVMSPGSGDWATTPHNKVTLPFLSFLLNLTVFDHICKDFEVRKKYSVRYSSYFRFFSSFFVQTQPFVFGILRKRLFKN